ncbi:MAG: alpha-amylase family glycosyl hydrolase [Bacteroidales bacterium]|nr:alpha-amylase family glycosyl hydrolase [Bacteroidales bacterium]
MIGLLLVWSCQPRPQSLFANGDDIYGLATPVQLTGDTTIVYLSDYFVYGSEAGIDSVTGTPRLHYELSDDKSMLYIISRSNFIPHLSELKIWLDGTAYSLMVRRSKLERFMFTFDPGDARYRTVALRGEMNDWSPVANRMNLIDGKWQTELRLNPGRYQYLIVANGRDMLDPNNPNIVDNNIGGFNSLLEVGNTDISLTPHLFTQRHNRHTIDLGVQNTADQVFVFWQNFRLPESNLDHLDNGIRIHVPGDALRQQRSFLRVWAYNEHGPSNDLLIPLEFGRPVTETSLLTREDKEATILYFMMVDRFNNGNPDNDDPVDHPEVADRANFWGGDIAGITEKIRDGYFDMLGINTIWMSPITQNPLKAYREFPPPRRMYTGYHGYWPITLTTLDHRFGTEEEMHELVQMAHGNNLSVMLDFVSNHVHEDNPIIIENPHWATTLNLPDGRKNIRLWDEHRLTTWFDTFLPSLDFTNPDVIELMSDSAFFWIDHYGMDGFRHDATKHVNLEFWRRLTSKLKEAYMIPNNKRLFQIGETFGSRELIGSYVGSGLLDGQFDFNLYFDARTVFASDEASFETLNYSLYQSFSHYGFNNLMGNITGNHDLPRFISLAGGDLRFDEDDTEPGWEREIGVGDPVGYNKLSQLTAFIMTIPGVPVIYYGDEVGLPGASDPDSRRPMKFDNLTPEQSWVRDRAARLAHLRSNHPVFIYGDFKTLKVSQNEYVYARSYFEEKALVLFNRDREARIISIELPERFTGITYEAQFGHPYIINGNVLEITMKPNSYEVLVSR